MSEDRAMRAKMRITRIERQEGTHEVLHFSAVSKSSSYPADGSDEDNTFAKFTPSGELRLLVNNPVLLGMFNLDDKFYLDFIKAKS